MAVGCEICVTLQVQDYVLVDPKDGCDHRMEPVVAKRHTDAPIENGVKEEVIQVTGD